MTRASHDNPLPHRVATGIRGPKRLREDIADEIADHLACHADANPSDDPTQAEADAVRAFGNPDEIARELRTVHLGEWIMFQRVMVAALVVIVIGMAATTYFSWSAARSSGEQLTEMNERLGSLVELQRAALPEPEPEPAPPAVKPRLDIFCTLAPDDVPAVGWQVIVRWATPSKRGNAPAAVELQTDANGRVQTEPLKPGRYSVAVYHPVPDAEADQPYYSARVSQTIDVAGADGESQEVHLVVATTHTHDLEITLPRQVTWDREAMDSAIIRFESKDSTGGYSLSKEYSVKLYASNRITGLLPGKAEVQLLLPGIEIRPQSGPRPVRRRLAGRPPMPAPSPDAREPRGVWYSLGEVTLPETGGTVAIDWQVEPEHLVSGIIYDGSRDKPIAHQEIQLVLSAKPYSRVERLLTDADGRFVTFNRQGLAVDGHRAAQWSFDPTAVRIPWKTAGGTPMVLDWPLADTESIKALEVVDGGIFYEIDMATVTTVRVTLPSPEELAATGREMWDDPSITWYQVISRGTRSHQDWSATPAWPEETTFEALAFPGNYTFRTKLFVTERDEETPEFERRCRYEQKSSSKIEVKPGAIAEVAIPLNNFEGWKLEDSEWHKRATADTKDPAPETTTTSSAG